jgi:hypothetical protein
MKRAILSFIIGSAALAILPGVAAAQCEGGTSTTGFYTTNGSYVPGGCAFTSSTTPGQMYPSGAQPLPSTNPALGVSALPGQPVATGLLPVRAGDLGQPLGAVGPSGETLGPGTPVINLSQPVTGINALPGQVTPSGILPVNTANVGSALGFEGISNGLVNTVNNGSALGVTTPNINGYAGYGGLVNGITTTRGLTNVTGTSTVSGLGAVPSISVPSSVIPTSPGTVAATTVSGQVLNGQQTLLAPSVNLAYGWSLPAGVAVSAQATSPTTPGSAEAPPAPGRGGPTFIGEERGSPDQVIVSLP